MFIFAVLYVGLEGQVQCDNLTVVRGTVQKSDDEGRELLKG